MYACKRGKRAVVKELLDAGGDVNIRDTAGDTCLVHAVKEGNDLALGRSLRLEDAVLELEDAKTLTLWAAGEGRLDVIQWIRAEGFAELGYRDRGGNTALIMAAAAGRVKMTTWLKEQGVYQFNVENNMGFTPLMAAALNGRHAMTTWLLEQGAEIDAINKFKHTAATIAATEGFLRVCKVLVDHGAHVEQRDVDMAAAKNHTAVVQFLRGKLATA